MPLTVVVVRGKILNCTRHFPAHFYRHTRFDLMSWFSHHIDVLQSQCVSGCCCWGSGEWPGNGRKLPFAGVWDGSMIKGDTDKSYPSAHPLKESLLPIECLLGWLPLSENAGKTLNQYWLWFFCNGTTMKGKFGRLSPLWEGTMCEFEDWKWRLKSCREKNTNLIKADNFFNSMLQHPRPNEAHIGYKLLLILMQFSCRSKLFLSLWRNARLELETAMDRKDRESKWWSNHAAPRWSCCCRLFQLIFLPDVPGKKGESHSFIESRVTIFLLNGLRDLIGWGEQFLLWIGKHQECTYRVSTKIYPSTLLTGYES